MTDKNSVRIAILYPGDYAARQNATLENNRFAQLFQAFAERGVDAETAVYHDDFYEEVRQQLMQVDGVLVWINPITNGRNRHILDAMLRDVAAAGIFVSTHPDVILKIGTKEVLYQTRSMGWGCDTHLYNSPEELRQKLPLLLGKGETRVLKQYRSNGGNGVWKVALSKQGNTSPQPKTAVKVRHAKRGSMEEEMQLGSFLAQCEPYFANDGKIIDQAYQSRLHEGMIRCYLVHDKVVGFGHQAINALYPAPAGAPPEEAPQPGPRLYHPPTMPEFQSLKFKLEQEWVPAMQQLLAIESESLPVLWDADFLLGPKEASGADSYVLCEINVSSVAPFPDSAIPFVIEAALQRAGAAKRSKQPFDLELAIEILSKTPLILKAWLGNLTEEWSHYKKDEASWSAFDILGHFIHGEQTDWIPRAQLILQRDGIQTFEPFDRFAQNDVSKGKTIENLLDEFSQLRAENLAILRGFNLQPADYEQQGNHPELGIVNLRQLLSSWVVHDLDHLAQIPQEMAKRYKEEVGPWLAYLQVLQ